MRKGFIDPVDKGGLRGAGLSCNIFRMSDRWKHYGCKRVLLRSSNGDSFHRPTCKNGRCVVAKSKAEKDEL